MSQDRLAKAVGVTFQQVQKYEKGTNRVSASRLYRIAEALGFDLMYFFADTTDPSRDRDNEHKRLAELGNFAYDIASEVSRIRDDRTKRAVKGLVAAIAADSQGA